MMPLLFTVLKPFILFNSFSVMVGIFVIRIKTSILFVFIFLLYCLNINVIVPDKYISQIYKIGLNPKNILLLRKNVNRRNYVFSCNLCNFYINIEHILHCRKYNTTGNTLLNVGGLN